MHAKATEHKHACSRTITRTHAHKNIHTVTHTHKHAYMFLLHNLWFYYIWNNLTRFNKIVNKIAIQGTPQMAVEKEARAYRESTHIVILSVTCPYTKCKLP